MDEKVMRKVIIGFEDGWFIPDTKTRKAILSTGGLEIFESNPQEYLKKFNSYRYSLMADVVSCFIKKREVD